MVAPRKELFAQANLVPKPGIGPNGLYDATPPSVEEIEASEKGWLAYFKTRYFYIVLVLGYVSWNEPYSGCTYERRNLMRLNADWIFFDSTMIGRFLLSASPLRIPSRLCLCSSRLPFLHFRRFSIIYSSI